MQIYEMLRNDHERLLAILREMESSSAEDMQLRRDLLEKLKAELIPHSKAEEVVLYDRISEDDATEDQVLESFEEHKYSEILLGDIGATDLSSKSWRAKVTVLKEMLEHHIREEE